MIALSMDGQGQPLAWFTVNQWVTGARWLSAKDTASLLATVKDIPKGASLVEKFLLYLIELYQADLEAILYERDRFLTKINEKNSIRTGRKQV